MPAHPKQQNPVGARTVVRTWSSDEWRAIACPESRLTNRVVWRERPTLPLADKPGRSRISRCTISSRMTGWATCVWPTVDRHHERVSDCKQLNWCTTTHDDMIKGHAELVQWVYLYWIITSHLFPENVKKEPSIAQLAKENQGGARDPSLNIGTHLHPLESKSV